MNSISLASHARPQTARLRPPGPRGLPLLGNYREVSRDPLAFFSACASQHGDVASFKVGRQDFTLLSHPDHVEQVLVKESQNFQKNTFFWRQVSAVFGKGLLTSEDTLWRRQRQLSAPALAPKKIGSYGPVMAGYADRILGQLKPGQVYDFHDVAMGLTLAIAARALFDVDVEDDVPEIDQAVNWVADEIASRRSRPIVIPDWFPFPGHRRYRRGLQRIDSFILRMIHERRLDGAGKDDLLSRLMNARDEQGQPMSERQLRDELITLLLAGYETTALALSWTVYLLGRHPDVDAELASEVRSVVGARKVEVGDVPKLVRTERAITEAMRLFPPAYAMGRETRARTEIGGYVVDPGMVILISPWVLHRDERFFESPTAFMPSRWDGELAKRLPRFAYMPFGGGPRVCIGSRFAMMEAVLILATLIQHVKLTLVPGREVVPMPSITLRPGGGVRVTAERRTGPASPH